jgi:hypothetical protein
MSSSLLHHGQQKEQVVDWARLIPGETQRFRRGGRKPSQAVRACTSEKVEEIETRQAVRAPENALTLLVPGPLQDRMAWRWMRATAVDFALVTLNWLLIGASLVPLRMLFPRVWSFAYAAGAPVSLLGIALLHAALITLMGYSEGLRAGDGNLRRQARILGKSIMWATALMCIAYGLQGVPWTVCGLFCGAGLLHFGAL